MEVDADHPRSACSLCRNDRGPDTGCTSGDDDDSWISACHLGVNGPVDVPTAVLFLASGERPNITGQLLTVAGGSKPSL
jgi:NAD(P)-dependent dehydrogenase (short-subunit alcohol dehydrogenase family)